MPKLNNILPCGFRKPRDLNSRIQHYSTCTHQECKDRAKKLESLKQALTGENYGDVA